MIETPALFPSMTALSKIWKYSVFNEAYQINPVIKRTLDMVGLQDTGKRVSAIFSLGMRQRLGDRDCTFKYTRTIDFRRTYQWS